MLTWHHFVQISAFTKKKVIIIIIYSFNIIRRIERGKMVAVRSKRTITGRNFSTKKYFTHYLLSVVLLLFIPSMKILTVLDSLACALYLVLF